MSKNIVVFSDGTGQDGGVGNNTNVYSLFNMIEDRTEQQVSFYDPGLGTGWRKVSGAISGYGITTNIRQCYQFISDNYQSGDRIFLIGFSRGATTVRTLSAFIDLFGILPRSRPELIQRAYKIYKKHKPAARREKADAFLKINHSIGGDVLFVGVWDTVAALGLQLKLLDRILDWLPMFKHKFHDLSLARNVKYARHAVAIDDERKTFHPQLWDEQDSDDDIRNPEELSEDDILDVHLIVERLRAEAESQDPVSRILTRGHLDDGKHKSDKPPVWDEESLTKIRNFNTEPRWLENSTAAKPAASARVQEYERTMAREEGLALRSILVEGFRKAINENVFADLYDLKGKHFEQMGFSDRLRRKIGDLHERKEWKHLNRCLLEHTYALRPTNYPRIKQVWFPGMHSDVGGGYASSQLAHVPLLWMIREAMLAGLRIYRNHKVDLRPDALGAMHDSRAGIGRLYKKETRYWDPNKNQSRLPLIHESAEIRKLAMQRGYEPWILKMKGNIEPWPQSMQSSIQFNDYYIWRERFWGQDNAFLVPWSNVDRFQYKETTRELQIHLSPATGKEAGPSKIVVKGVPPVRESDLMDHFEQRIVEIRKKKAEKKTTDDLKKQDKNFKKKDKQHTKDINRLEKKLAELEDELDRSRNVPEPLEEQEKEKPKPTNGEPAPH